MHNFVRNWLNIFEGLLVSHLKTTVYNAEKLYPTTSAILNLQITSRKNANSFEFPMRK